MAPCRIVARESKVNPHLACSTLQIEGWCEVHFQYPNQSGMCPVGQLEKATEDALEKIKGATDDRMRDLEIAIFDIVNMERAQTPDMSGKRRTYAYMRNGKVLAECLDRARALLPYDMQPTDPHHGGKISK